MEAALSEEKKTLARLIYRSKNQHKSSKFLRKMVQLKRLTDYRDLSKGLQSRILECCMNLYCISSMQIKMEYFVPINLCAMGIAARIYVLIKKIKTQPASQIDDIFASF
ncbi:hypothetical protein ENBRE01_1337 [Enteropsectra breve]|nr:hypothetical protein ENBRE01_1337 [Enteropsectra breve]